MKVLLNLFLLLIIETGAQAQNIGIGTNNPLTSLDVKGAIRTRPDTIAVTQNYQVLNVANTNFVRIAPNAEAADDGYIILLSPGKDGQWLRIENINPVTDYGVAIMNGSYLSNGKRIMLTSGNFVFDAPGYSIDLFYSDLTGWTERQRNATTVSENKIVFTTPGSFIVPVGVTKLHVALWGAGGFGGGGMGRGGNGGFVAGTINVTYGQSIDVLVAQATTSASYAGYSSVQSGFPVPVIYALAAGGGNGSENGGTGGHAGNAGQDGTTGSGGTGGAGGGAALGGGAGGAAGTGIGAQAGTNGGYLIAGLCNSLVSSEGDGGRGFYGGGGAGTYMNLGTRAAGGGGGGRNNYLGSGMTHNTHVGQIVPPHPLYDTGGTGGTGNGNGAAGKVIITW